MSEYAIEMHNITKIFGNLTANNDITLLVKKGEIHGIVGENGAGKSTLMSILFGLVKPNTGIILVNGVVKRIRNAVDAEKIGIGMVQQHFQLIDIYNAVENIILGSEPANKFGVIDYSKAKKNIEALIEQYQFNINLKVSIDQLTVGQQQKIEILKLLYRNSDILIFDEPTGVLTPDEIEKFLQLLKYFKSIGKTIIIISHKLDEIKRVCDRATVIKLGEVVDVVNLENTSVDQLSSLMVGRTVVEVKNEKRDYKKNKNKVIFSVSHLNREPTKSSMKLDDVSFSIRAGEILAIAGVEGNGQSELINIITGLEDYSFKKQKNKYSSIKLDWNEILGKSIKRRYQLGLSHIPEDRQKYGLILNSELKNSMFLQEYNVPPFAKNGFISKKAVEKWTHDLIAEYDVRGSNGGEANASALSGGNQQKAIIAREISRENKVIIVAQPTRGLDVGAIASVHSEILRQKENNKAILLISYELREVFALADRILVISSGQISKELDPAKTSYKEIGLLMAGLGDKAKIDSLNKNKSKPIVRKSPQKPHKIVAKPVISISPKKSHEISVKSLVTKEMSHEISVKPIVTKSPQKARTYKSETMVILKKPKPVTKHSISKPLELYYEQAAKKAVAKKPITKKVVAKKVVAKKVVAKKVVAKKPITKKAVAKKAVAKKPIIKKPVAKKVVAKKVVAKKVVAKKVVAKKVVAKKVVAKKVVAKKVVAKKVVAKKVVAKKVVAKKPITKKAVAKKAVAKKPIIKKPVAKKVVAKKVVAKKAVAKKAVAKKAVAKKAVAKKPIIKKPVAKKVVAKKVVAKKPITKKPVAKKVVAKKPVAKVSAIKAASRKAYHYYAIQKASNKKDWELKKENAKRATVITKTKKDAEEYYEKYLKSADNTFLVEKSSKGDITQIYKLKKPIKIRKRKGTK